MRFAVVVVVVVGLGLAAARPCAEIKGQKHCKSRSHLYTAFDELCAWDKEKQTCGDAAETSGLASSRRCERGSPAASSARSS